MNVPIRSGDELSCKSADVFQIGAIDEADDEFLHTSFFKSSQTPTNCCRAANQSIIQTWPKPGSECLRDLCNGLLIAVGKGAEGRRRAMNAIVITSNGLAMLFNY